MTPPKEEFAYGSAVFTSLGVEEAIERIESALADEGWSVMFDLDLQRVLREKAGAEFRPYRIIGVCQPKLALEALGYEEHLGLLMPCNIVVSRDGDRTKVAAISAREQLRVTNNGMLAAIADRVDEQLATVLDSLPQEA